MDPLNVLCCSSGALVCCSQMVREVWQALTFGGLVPSCLSPLQDGPEAHLPQAPRLPQPVQQDQDREDTRCGAAQCMGNQMCVKYSWVDGGAEAPFLFTLAPGGKLVYQYVKKASSPTICGVSGAKLNGVSPL